MKIYRTSGGLFYRAADGLHPLPPGFTIDSLFAAPDPGAYLRSVAKPEAGKAATSQHAGHAPASITGALAPIQSQEVWAAGVTYQRSRVARIAESKDAGGGAFYDKVYEAERPELFFKSTPHRVASPGDPVRIRRDAKWNVPEPELTLAINAAGRIFGYTVGNDMSSRDIEAENPLYLPQAKVYDRSAALGPCLLVQDEPLPPETEIVLEIHRSGKEAFSGRTPISRIKRSFTELAEFLFRDNSFPHGCYLMTGTGIVPPDAFTLEPDDEIRITIAAIGTLTNTVARLP